MSGSLRTQVGLARAEVRSTKRRDGGEGRKKEGKSEGKEGKETPRKGREKNILPERKTEESDSEGTGKR